MLDCLISESRPVLSRESEREWERETLSTNHCSERNGKKKRKKEKQVVRFIRSVCLWLSVVGDIDFDLTSKKSKSDPLWIYTTKRWWILWGEYLSFSCSGWLAERKSLHTHCFSSSPVSHSNLSKKEDEWLSYMCPSFACLTCCGLMGSVANWLSVILYIYIRLCPLWSVPPFCPGIWNYSINNNTNNNKWDCLRCKAELPANPATAAAGLKPRIMPTQPSVFMSQGLPLFFSLSFPFSFRVCVRV